MTSDSPETYVGELAPADRTDLAYLQIAVPPELAVAVQRHHAALGRFAANLGAAGIGRDVATQCIAELVDSYRRELAVSIVTYRERFDGR